MGQWEGEVCGYGEEGVGWDGWVEEGYGVINFFFGVPLKEIERRCCCIGVRFDIYDTTYAMLARYHLI